MFLKVADQISEFQTKKNIGLPEWQEVKTVQFRPWLNRLTQKEGDFAWEEMWCYQADQSQLLRSASSTFFGRCMSGYREGYASMQKYKPSFSPDWCYRCQLFSHKVFIFHQQRRSPNLIKTPSMDLFFLSLQTSMPSQGSYTMHVRAGRCEDLYHETTQKLTHLDSVKNDTSGFRFKTFEVIFSTDPGLLNIQQLSNVNNPGWERKMISNVLLWHDASTRMKNDLIIGSKACWWFSAVSSGLLQMFLSVRTHSCSIRADEMSHNRAAFKVLLWYRLLKPQSIMSSYFKYCLVNCSERWRP